MLQVIASRIEFGAKSARTDAADVLTAAKDHDDHDGDDAPEDFTDELTRDEEVKAFSVVDEDIPF
jgi:hypothetical protein